MGYLINPTTKGWRTADGQTVPAAGEVYADVIYPADDGVWDAASQTIRAPNSAEILTATRAQTIEQINTEATSRILTAYPMEKQISASLGVYPTAYKDKMSDDIAAVIGASNTATDQVIAALDVAGVEAVAVLWPVIGD